MSISSNRKYDPESRKTVGRPVVLLVNSSDVEPDWITEAQAFCAVQRANPTDEDIDARIRLFSPHILCFEFGAYDPRGLTLLARTKLAHLSLPVLMITEEHSEALAVWALRTRVWDYFVKPVVIEELQWAIATLYATVIESRSIAPRRMVQPRIGERANTREDNRTRAEKAVEKVRTYVSRHLSSKLSEGDISDYCAMSHYHLSRTFRRVSGLTLREYILRERIRKAAQLLSALSASVTTVCYEVGFHDLSHFARMFRRYMGMTPSEYRMACLGGEGARNAHLYLHGPKQEKRGP